MSDAGVTLDRSWSRLPVTALAFASSRHDTTDLLLAGEDTHLNVYQVGDGPRSPSPEEDLLLSVNVFHGQSIHGICVEHGHALLWGGSSLAFIPNVDTIDSGILATDVPVVTVQASDWIYDAKISPADSSRAACINAHNEVIHIDLPQADFHSTPQTQQDRGKIHLGTPISPSRPILFSGTLRYESPDSLLVVGGTAFGEILVWRCTASSRPHVAAELGGAKVQMLHVLSGHEGSIFGVDLWCGSGEQEIPADQEDTPVRTDLILLASCSDDRTIRIWDITGQCDTSNPATNLSTLGEARETGFGVTPVEQTTNGNAEASAYATPIAVAMGHASRIWGVRFSPVLVAVSEGRRECRVFSFGEDSTMQTWQLSVAPSPKDDKSGREASLSHVSVTSLHDGKHLWSHAVATRWRNTVLATGGADGRISLINSSSDTSPSEVSPSHGSMHVPHNQTVTFDAKQIIESLAASPSSPVQAKEIINRYDFVSADQVMLTTSTGRLLIGSFVDSRLTWSEIPLDPDVQDDLRLCYVMQHLGDGVVVMGSSAGKVYYYNLNAHDKQVKLVTTLLGKIVAIYRLQQHRQRQSSTKGGEGSVTVDMVMNLHGVAGGLYLKVDCTSGRLLSERALEGVDDRFRTTTASRIGDLLFLGSRHGFMSILRRVQAADTQDAFRQVGQVATRSRDAITCIVPLPSAPEESGQRMEHSSARESRYVLATSRDGKYRIYEVVQTAAATPTDDQVTLRLVHETGLPFGPMIEGAWFSTSPGQSPGTGGAELILYGFKSQHFIVWNETAREEVATVDCGGAHRTFTFAVSDSDGRHGGDGTAMRFACTRASKLCLYSQAETAHRVVKRGTHGREIRTVSCQGSYVATGSEDTTIRIWKMEGEGSSDKSGGLRCLAAIKTHTTGLQRVKWFGERYLLSSAGNEELYVWRIESVSAGGYDMVGVTCEGVYADKSPLGDLRIMDFDVSSAPAAAADTPGISSSEAGMIVTLALSSSQLKTYVYEGGSFQLVGVGRYTGACLTQVRHVQLDSVGLELLTASTDGNLALWKAPLWGATPGRFMLQRSALLHRSAIKCLDLRWTARSRGFRVVTGGDDNSLGLVVMEESAEHPGTYRIASRRIVRDAHAAAINGVVFQPGQRTEFATISNDQRLKLWRWPERESARGVSLVKDVYSGVADPGDVDMAGATKSLVLAGVGIEIWKVGQ